MHTDLSAHLHTDECNDIIQQFLYCNSHYTFQRFLGKCSYLDTQVTKCQKKERLQRREHNRQQAVKEQAERLKRMSEDNN
ncbi:COX assembly mitochondrial protein 2 homolog [Arctopsyche grandis]|uniref:COX assembly mitochondrial protein 2 homolog n=1 Tax=Arctopsyche grandis TaxID=121162 RepID=UPI00406DA382